MPRLLILRLRNIVFRFIQYLCNVNFKKIAIENKHFLGKSNVIAIDELFVLLTPNLFNLLNVIHVNYSLDITIEQFLFVLIK